VVALHNCEEGGRARHEEGALSRATGGAGRRVGSDALASFRKEIVVCFRFSLHSQREAVRKRVRQQTACAQAPFWRKRLRTQALAPKRRLHASALQPQALAHCVSLPHPGTSNLNSVVLGKLKPEIGTNASAQTNFPSGTGNRQPHLDLETALSLHFRCLCSGRSDKPSPSGPGDDSDPARRADLCAFVCNLTPHHEGQSDGTGAKMTMDKDSLSNHHRAKGFWQTQKTAYAFRILKG
jgi:hypothetical protein